MCVCTLFKANPMGERVRAHVLKGKINFTATTATGLRGCLVGGDKI
jgi:hypothetical protein